ncbi:unnamed protein product [Cylicostephanus goldi]|uniref:Protein HIRA-like C-terminal domain-containing protein n=1 Tax=Cylicostephanus goldi TaxID=71465 RepID=A0A3P7MQE7_CYLGO|nr:unnamed protein product [Cylicostephanus goldi]
MYVLTQTGHLSTWDVDKMKAILSRQSIADCVAKDANLTSISVTPMGIPLLGFSTGTIFTFSLDMNCWPGLLPSVPRTISASVKESLLEGWLQAAKTAGSTMDYRGLLMTYVQQLVRNRSTSKLSDILTELREQGYICGTLRSALREDVEKIIASDPVTSSLIKSKETDSLVF